MTGRFLIPSGVEAASLPNTSHMETQTGCTTISPALCRAKTVEKALAPMALEGSGYLVPLP